MSFLTLLREYRRTKKGMKDKWNRHGAVSKSSSEQQFHKSDAINFAVLNFWSRTPSAIGSYGRQAGWLQLADEIQLIFKIHYRSKISIFSSFNKGIALLQQLLYQCI